MTRAWMAKGPWGVSPCTSTGVPTGTRTILPWSMGMLTRSRSADASSTEHAYTPLWSGESARKVTGCPGCSTAQSVTAVGGASSRCCGMGAPPRQSGLCSTWNKQFYVRSCSTWNNQFQQPLHILLRIKLDNNAAALALRLDFDPRTQRLRKPRLQVGPYRVVPAHPHGRAYSLPRRPFHPGPHQLLRLPHGEPLPDDFLHQPPPQPTVVHAQQHLRVADAHLASRDRTLDIRLQAQQSQAVGHRGTALPHLCSH